MAASDLHQYLSSLGVNERTCRRWIAAAVELGLLIPFRRTRSRVSGFRYLSPDRAALQVGCPHLGSRPVAVSAQGALVALGEIEQGSLRPKRIFHLPR